MIESQNQEKINLIALPYCKSWLSDSDLYQESTEI